MYPLVRFVSVLARGHRGAALAPDGESRITLTIRPWDLDMFFELNNGRALTLYDLGRFDYSARVGLIKLLRQRGWQFAVAGGSVRFRQRVRLFDRVQMRTRVVGAEGRWIYIAQSMWVRGRPVSSLLVRTAVTDRAGAVMAAEVMAALGIAAAPPTPDWVRAWAAADATRPWPPD